MVELHVRQFHTRPEGDGSPQMTFFRNIDSLFEQVNALRVTLVVVKRSEALYTTREPHGVHGRCDSSYGAHVRNLTSKI